MKPQNYDEMINGWSLSVRINAGPTYGVLDTYIKSPTSTWWYKIAVHVVTPDNMDAAIQAGRKAIETGKDSHGNIVGQGGKGG